MPALSEAQKRFQEQLPEDRVFQTRAEILQFDPEKMWKIAEAMVNFSLEVVKGDRLLIESNPGSRQLVEMIGYIAASNGAAVVNRCKDSSVEAAIFAGAGQSGQIGIHDEMMVPHYADVGWATKVACVRCVDDPDAMEIVDPKTYAAANKAFEARLRLRVDRRRWTLIYIPTKAEAARDQMGYEEYVDMFLRACDRPWTEVKAAQEVLVKILRLGDQLELYADENNPDKNWRTSLRMSIKGMIFANATVDVNFPGSETFASPRRRTIEGQLALPYPVVFGDKPLPNLILRFEKGKVVEHSTGGDTQWVEKILNTDKGAREVGEVAFGTNPVFDRPMLNRMFVEKVGGSFHIAVGAAYPWTEFAGQQVVIDNGVRSANHEDLTRMMLAKYGGGRVVLDGQLIQENGFFLDERLSVLNPAS